MVAYKMNKTLNEFVTRHWVKKLPTVENSRMEDVDSSISLYRKAGFKSLAQTYERNKESLEQRSQFNEELEKFLEKAKNRVLLREPAFRTMIINDKAKWWNTITYLAFCGMGLSLALGIIMDVTDLCAFSLAWLIPIAISMFKSADAKWDNAQWRFKGVKMDFQKILVETDVSDYVGEVPLEIAQKTIQLREEGLEPKIWFIGNKDEVKSVLEKQLVPRDPLLVGVHPHFRLGYAILAAIWGEDVEDLDKYFSERKPNESKNHY